VIIDLAHDVVEVYREPTATGYAVLGAA